MSGYDSVQEMIEDIRQYADIGDDGVTVSEPEGLRENVIDKLAATAVFGGSTVLPVARWLIWETSQALGCRSASMHDHYLARRDGRWSNRTTPAICLRAMSYDSARAAFRAAAATGTAQIIFDLGRGEIDPTGQRPYEYVASVLAAAIREAHHGPVFLQAGHLHIHPARFAENAKREIESIKGLTLEASGAGFYNFQVDGSTLTLERDDGTPDQFENARRSAELLNAVGGRQPNNLPIMIGAGIGELTTQEKAVTSLREFMEQLPGSLPSSNLSKVGVLPGPDAHAAIGQIAELTEFAKREYGLGISIREDLSLAEDAVLEGLSRADVTEVWLATALLDTVFDSAAFPAALRDELYSWLDRTRWRQRREDQTDDEFHYTTRHTAIGPFKAQFWSLHDDVRTAIRGELEAVFNRFFRLLGVTDTAELVAETTTSPRMPRHRPRAMRDVSL